MTDFEAAILMPSLITPLLLVTRCYEELTAEGFVLKIANNPGVVLLLLGQLMHLLIVTSC